MRLDKLMEESANIQDALEKMGVPRSKKRAQDDIFVHAYVVHSFWRKYPAKWRQRKLAVIRGGRR